MTGKEIKALVKGAGVKLWEVADSLNMRDSEFSRRLRKPFNEAEVANIKRIINELSVQNKSTNN